METTSQALNGKIDIDKAVSDLYALRAGLCLISQEYYECKKEQDSAKAKSTAEISKLELSPRLMETENKLQEIRNKISASETKKSALESELDSSILIKKHREDNINANENNKYAIIRSKKEFRQSVAIFVCFLLWILAFIAVEIILFSTHLSLTGLRLYACWGIVTIGLTIWYIVKGVVVDCDDVNGYLIVFCALLAVVDLLAFLGLFKGVFFRVLPIPISLISGGIVVTISFFAGGKAVHAADYSKECMRKQINYKSPAESSLIINETTIHNLELDIIKTDDEIVKYKASEQEAMARLNDISLEIKRKSDIRCEQCNYECSEIEKAHGKIAESIWQLLVTNYNKLLDSRDWGNLDLIIYTLETGRAETMKEALQLADREIQTDRVVESVNRASEQITCSLHNGFGNLQSQINDSFNTLSIGLARSFDYLTTNIDSQMVALGAKIESQTKVIDSFGKAQLSEAIIIGNRIEKLTSKADLQNALLEKGNESSLKLIEEAKKIRKKI